MRPASRIARRFVVAMAIAGVVLIGWVGRTIRAQDSPKASPPASPAEAALPAPEATPSKVSEPSLEAISPPQATARQVPDHLPTEPAAAGPGDDDPEKNARAFIERNRKEAQEELKKLKDEAQRLRTRLGKVEAGVQRWEALLAALESSEKVATARAGRAARSSADTPPDLTERDVVPARFHPVESSQGPR